MAKECKVNFTVAFLPSESEPYPLSTKMTWKELKEMRDSGLVEVASHSFDHFDLTGLSEGELRGESHTNDAHAQHQRADGRHLLRRQDGLRQDRQQRLLARMVQPCLR